MERANRWVVGACAIALWIITAAVAVAELNMRVYFMVWLATAILTLWALVEIWLSRPDHGGLAKVRSRLYEARLNGALMEEEDLRVAEDRRARRHLNRVG